MWGGGEDMRKPGWQDGVSGGEMEGTVQGVRKVAGDSVKGGSEEKGGKGETHGKGEELL